ncbi:histone-lysine N-methyltransferase, H3 lysine-79 specific-like [Benincasa hispida]|uniref:histone-lysine N-methyltransferase, H3 lysine-79 specific-like n=1 Tax=Benincasa hispida TaxID=102211 RepID=UPI0019000026|nr:histone-lysine N-methyltransferase, H3 lysine-79 specific-like [Benincasa hispida]
MEKEGGLLEAGVVNQTLPLEEEMEEASRRSALAVLDTKETVQAESYERPFRVALEEVVVEKQPKVVEEKKIKEKRVEEDEQAHPIKKKERSERRERRQKKGCLKKEEDRRKRAESPERDGESTSVRGEKGESAKSRESALPEEETTKIRLVATDDGEDADITLMTRRHRENAPQGSIVDPPIVQDTLEEKERRRKEEEEK